MLTFSRLESYSFKIIICLLIICCGLNTVQAQGVLSKPVSVNINHTRLADALNEISKAGKFYFSYSGKVLPKDSLVSVELKNQPVGQALSQLFSGRYEWEERDNYIIITAPLRRLSMINTDLTAEDNFYSVSGIVTDVRTGERLMNASVYEKHRLMATLTDDHGYFRLKFRVDDSAQISLTAGKLAYKDTTINFLHPVKVSSRSGRDAYRNTAYKGNRVETTGFGSLLISARQKIQSLNIPDFFASRPFQVSLTPGLSSHGMFSPQVVNKFSLNILGGYTAGVNGVEIGGLFNINKQDSRYLQAAGIFNMVGGSVQGLQIAGVHNLAIDTVKGVQFAGLINHSAGQVSGLQLTILHNEAHILKGVQIGLVNKVDTSYGASIGLINIIRNGFYKVTYSANDVSNTNISLKTGTHAFYSEVLTSSNISVNQKFYSVGLGIGHDFMFSDKFYISAEANYQFANSGVWDDRWTQGKLLLNVQLTKNISFVGGPTFNHYYHSGSLSVPGYKNITNARSYNDVVDYTQVYWGDRTRNWLGWEAGIAFNSLFKPVKRAVDNSQSWYLGLAATAGGWDALYNRAYGDELFTQRDLGNGLSAILSVGYTTFVSNENTLYHYADPGSNYTIESVTMPYKIIPIKFGIRSMVTKKFYIGGDLGEAWAKRNDGFYEINNGVKRDISGEAQLIKSFVFSATTGFDFGNGLDAGIKFEDYTGFSEVKQFALRLGYKIKLSK